MKADSSKIRTKSNKIFKVTSNFRAVMVILVSSSALQIGLKKRFG